MTRIITKAHLVITYIFTCLGLVGIMLWIIGFAYYPKHPEWTDWVVPVQQALFIFCVGLNIVSVMLLIFPREWITDKFISWAENEKKRIVNK